MKRMAALMTHLFRDGTTRACIRNDTELQHENFYCVGRMTERRMVPYSVRLGEHQDGNRFEIPARTTASCADLFSRVQIGTKFMSGNARGALDLEYTQRRNLFPLRNRLRGHADQLRKSGLSADALLGALQW